MKSFRIAIVAATLAAVSTVAFASDANANGRSSVYATGKSITPKSVTTQSFDSNDQAGSNGRSSVYATGKRATAKFDAAHTVRFSGIVDGYGRSSVYATSRSVDAKSVASRNP